MVKRKSLKLLLKNALSCQRFLGLLLIVRVIAPLVIVTVGMLLLIKFVSDARNAMGEPLKKINSFAVTLSCESSYIGSILEDESMKKELEDLKGKLKDNLKALKDLESSLRHELTNIEDELRKSFETLKEAYSKWYKILHEIFPDIPEWKLPDLGIFTIRDQVDLIQIELDKGKISKDLRKEFGDNWIELSRDATVSMGKEGTRWRITDGMLMYVVKKKVVRGSQGQYDILDIYVIPTLPLPQITKEERSIGPLKADLRPLKTVMNQLNNIKIDSRAIEGLPNSIGVWKAKVDLKPLKEKLRNIKIDSGALNIQGEIEVFKKVEYPWYSLDIKAVPMEPPGYWELLDLLESVPELWEDLGEDLEAAFQLLANLKAVSELWKNIEPRFLFQINPGSVQSELDSGIISVSLRREFEHNGSKAPSEDATIAIGKEGSKWWIIDNNQNKVYLIKKEDDALKIYDARLVGTLGAMRGEMDNMVKEGKLLFEGLPKIGRSGKTMAYFIVISAIVFFVSYIGSHLSPIIQGWRQLRGRPR